MKVLHLLLGILVAPLAHAEALTLGIPDGTYEGGGMLFSETAWVPTLDFHSVRILQNGMIHAKSEAKLLGLVVASAEAKLQFLPEGNGHFTVWDLVRNAKAGTARCNRASCTYQVTVMGGKLQLQETLVRSLKGFRLLDGHQIFDKKAASYATEFTRVR